MNRKELVELAKKFNSLKVDGKPVIDPIDIKVKEDELRELFGQAVDSVLDNEEYGATEEERQQKLPEEIRAAYKKLFLSDEEPNEEPNEEPDEKPAKTEKKSSKKPAEKKEPAKKPAAKPAAKKSSKESDKKPSRKLTIYKVYRSKGDFLKEGKKLGVKEKTLKIWSNRWKNNKGLPKGM